MAFMLTGDLGTAQDLTQEAFLRTWVRWSRVAKYDDPLGWTRRVLYNLAVQQISWRSSSAGSCNPGASIDTTTQRNSPHPGRRTASAP